MNRRGFLRGLIAAPAIVAASSLMPVRSIERLLRRSQDEIARDIAHLLEQRIFAAEAAMREHMNKLLYGDPDLPTLELDGLQSLLCDVSDDYHIQGMAVEVVRWQYT